MTQIGASLNPVMLRGARTSSSATTLNTSELSEFSPDSSKMTETVKMFDYWAFHDAGHVTLKAHQNDDPVYPLKPAGRLQEASVLQPLSQAHRVRCMAPNLS